MNLTNFELFTEDGKLYVVDKDRNMLYIIDNVSIESIQSVEEMIEIGFGMGKRPGETKTEIMIRGGDFLTLVDGSAELERISKTGVTQIKQRVHRRFSI